MTWIFWKRKRNLQEKRISDIDLADDIALFSDTKEGLQEMIDETSQDASLANLKIAVGVTKNAYTNLISFGKVAGSNKNLQTKELETAPRVDSYRHLGHLQDNETSSTNKDRLKLACTSFASMRGIWISSLSSHIKLRLYDVLIYPILNFGSGALHISQKMLCSIDDEINTMRRIASQCNKLDEYGFCYPTDSL